MTVVYGKGYLPYSGGLYPHEAPYSQTGAWNMAGWMDPTFVGDDLLRTAKLSADLGVMNGYYQNMQSSGNNHVFIDDFSAQYGGSIFFG